MFDEVEIATDLAEIKGDIKLLLLKMEGFNKCQEDHEIRIRDMEKESTTSRRTMGIIVAIAGAGGGLVIVLLEALLNHFL